MEMKGKIEKKREEEKASKALAARPSQPQHARGLACGLATPARSPPSLAAAAAGPRVSAARRPRPRVSPPPLAAAACWTPHVSPTVLLLHAHADSPLRQNPDSNGRAGQGVTPGAWPCPPLRRAHATTHGRRMGCTPPIPINLQPLKARLHGRARL